MYDFSKLTPINSANPKGQNFDIKWNVNKHEFTFSDKMFEKMTLEYNSLAQRNDMQTSMGEDGVEVQTVRGVFLFVCPGNDGVFHKKAKGKQKGKRFKNEKLSTTCIELGILPKDIAISYEGAFEDKEVYRLYASIKTEEAPPVGAEEAVAPTQEQESVNSVLEDRF